MQRYIRSMIVVGAGIMVASLAVPARADLNLLQNGGFETPQAFNPPGYSSPPLSNGDLPGWSIPNGNVETINGYWPAFEGLQSLDLDGLQSAGTITQDFPTVPGQVYALSFVYGNNPGSDPFPPGAIVSLSYLGDDELTHDLLNQQITHSTSTLSDMHWTSFFDVFVALTPVTTLTFASTDNPTSPGGIALDAASITAVPEPVSLAVWSLLGLCVAGWSWRHKK